jgi:hypothetical protein
LRGKERKEGRKILNMTEIPSVFRHMSNLKFFKYRELGFIIADIMYAERERKDMQNTR